MLHLSYTKHPKHSSAIRTNGSQHLLGALPTLSRTCEYRLMCTLSLHSNYSISSIVFNNSISSTVLFSGYACPTRGEDENDRLTTQSKPPLAVRILFSGRPGEGGYTWGGGACLACSRLPFHLHQLREEEASVRHNSRQLAGGGQPQYVDGCVQATGTGGDLEKASFRHGDEAVDWVALQVENTCHHLACFALKTPFWPPVGGG